MVAEQLSPISLRAFNRATGTDWMYNSGYYETFTGRRAGIVFAERARRVGENHRYVRSVVDRKIFHAIPRIYALTEQTDTREFFRTQMKTANDTIQEVIDTLFPGYRSVVAMRNEVKLSSGSPSDAMQLIISDSDPRLKFELMRQMTLALIAAPLDAQARNHQLTEELVKIQRILGSKLYDGQIGYAETIQTYAQHDNETNEAVYVVGDDDPRMNRPSGVHWKVHQHQMRPIGGIGHVLTDVGEKSPTSSVIKALKKAILRQQEHGLEHINPAEDVKDLIRMMFVVKGEPNISDAEKVSELIELVETTILKNDKEKRVEGFEPDDKTNGDKTQSENTSFKRRQMKFRDLPVPVEMIYMSMKEFLNYRFEIGRYSQSRGKYTGSAHTLYEISRLIDALPYLYPQEIYYPNPNDLNLLSAAYTTLHGEAERLRAEFKVELPR